MELEQAREIFLDSLKQIEETETVSLSSSYGRITASDIYSETDVPSFPKSAMDGYAVRASDILNATETSPVILSVKEEVDAGDVPGSVYEEGAAVRIMTGAMLPDGYDSVVKQEDTDYGSEIVKIFHPVNESVNVCPVGENVKNGDLLVGKNTKIGRSEAGMLASAGINEIIVRRKPRIAIISTGSELQKPGEKLAAGKIYNSISYMLEAELYGKGFELLESKICPDNEKAIREELETVLNNADFIITTGGVSVGKKDLLPAVLESIGAITCFKRINIQPGTPTIGSVKDGKGILSLSGNPFAALANFDMYFYHAMQRLTGNDAYVPKTCEAVLGQDYDKTNKVRRLIRAKTENGRVYLPEGGNKSSVISNLSECNCYIDLEAGSNVKKGDKVKIIIPG